MKILRHLKKLVNKNSSEQGYMGKPAWWDYVILYPWASDPDYDGVHDGGIKGIRNDAPEKMKKEFYDFYKDYEENPNVL